VVRAVLLRPQLGHILSAPTKQRPGRYQKATRILRVAFILFRKCLENATGGYTQGIVYEISVEIII
jgi:hypothetical protein